MWKLEDLQSKNLNQVKINGKWVSARPLNFTKEYCSIFNRFKYAFAVVRGKAETFYWPENQ